MKTEIWNGFAIRFAEYRGEWWAVATDVTEALGLGNTTNAVKRLRPENQALISIKGIGKNNEPINVVDELGLYDLVFGSRKKEAKEFKYWVFGVIKKLRQKSGLEGFEVFRMLDKEHQLKMMRQLSDGLKQPKQVDFIKANTIANKAVSSANGYSKMVKKGDMSPEMLIQRQPVLEDTVNLMAVNDSFDLGLSVSRKVYEKYQTR